MIAAAKGPEQHDLDRFWSKVDRSGACWLWVAAKTAPGYGAIWWNGRVQLAHRVAYELENGPIPEGREIDHLCRNRTCIRHLEAVDHVTNVRRGMAGMEHIIKNFCPRGHEYTPENTYLFLGKWRHCRPCRVIRNRAYRKRKAAAA